jgi:heat shock protein beta
MFQYYLISNHKKLVFKNSTLMAKNKFVSKYFEPNKVIDINDLRDTVTSTSHIRLICRASDPESHSIETFPYQAEVNRVMDMIVNSLYSNKDTFLRELISNASDALDKVRFISIERPDILFGKQDMEIRIKADSSSATLCIEDDGIGMTREDLCKNLGTIARSGTLKFVEALKERQKRPDTNQIGQFGVGFYSAFLVANKVKVQTLHPDSDAQWVWESTLI